MTDAEKFALLKRIVDKAMLIAELRNVGREAVLTEIYRLIMSLKAFTVEETSRLKANYITKQMLVDLKEANITPDYFERFQNTLAEKKTLARESLIKLMENSLWAGHPLNAVAAREELLKVIAGNKTPYLKDPEITLIHDTVLTESEPVFQESYIQSIALLLNSTSSKPREAFDLLDNLAESQKKNMTAVVYSQQQRIIQRIQRQLEVLTSKTTLTPQQATVFLAQLPDHEKDDVAPLIRKQQKKIIDIIQQQLAMGKDFDDLFPDIKLLLQGTPSLNPELNEAFSKLDQRLSGILCREMFLEELQTLDVPQLRIRLAQQVTIFRDTVVHQTTDSAKKLIRTFEGWTYCQLTHHCHAPDSAPQLIARNTTQDIFVERLADAILDHDQQAAMPVIIRSLDSVQEKVSQLANEWDVIVYFKDDYFKNNMANNTDPVAIKQLLSSQELKDNLVEVLERKILWDQANNAATDFYKQGLWSKPAVNTRILTKAFESWVSCYLVVQNSSLLRQACQSLWNSTIELVTAPAKVLAATPLTLPPPVELQTQRQTVTSGALDTTGVELVQIALVAGGLFCTGALMYNRFFKAKKPHTAEYQPLPTTEKRVGKQR